MTDDDKYTAAWISFTVTLAKILDVGVKSQK